MEGWHQNRSYGDWLEGFGVDSSGSRWGPLVGCCEHSDETSGSDVTELVILDM
jgi:hypothetical protein